jgi:hypothetical protein
MTLYILLWYLYTWVFRSGMPVVWTLRDNGNVVTPIYDLLGQQADAPLSASVLPRSPHCWPCVCNSQTIPLPPRVLYHFVHPSVLCRAREGIVRRGISPYLQMIVDPRSLAVNMREFCNCIERDGSQLSWMIWLILLQNIGTQSRITNTRTCCMSGTLWIRNIQVVSPVQTKVPNYWPRDYQTYHRYEPVPMSGSHW